MKIPRDLSGSQFIKALEHFGYQVTRQTGSHVRLTTERGGRHSVTIPNHSDLKIGTISAILAEVARHADLSRDDLLNQLFR